MKHIKKVKVFVSTLVLMVGVVVSISILTHHHFTTTEAELNQITKQFQSELHGGVFNKVTVERMNTLIKQYHTEGASDQEVAKRISVIKLMIVLEPSLGTLERGNGEKLTEKWVNFTHSI